MTNVIEERDEVKSAEFVTFVGAQVRQHLDELARSSLNETLNALLDAEADELCQAKRYERHAAFVDTRAGSYQRKLQIRVGKVGLTVPRLRNLPFESQVIERHRRRESSVKEALVEMYIAGVSVRRVEDIMICFSRQWYKRVVRAIGALVGI
jgi:putative transposase